MLEVGLGAARQDQAILLFRNLPPPPTARNLPPSLLTLSLFPSQLRCLVPNQLCQVGRRTLAGEARGWGAGREGPLGSADSAVTASPIVAFRAGEHPLWQHQPSALDHELGGKEGSLGSTVTPAAEQALHWLDE